MKIVRKPMDIVVIFKRKELPIRVRMIIDGQKIPKIDCVIKVQRQKTVCKGEIIYTCQSPIMELIKYAKYKIKEYLV